MKLLILLAAVLALGLSSCTFRVVKTTRPGYHPSPYSRIAPPSRAPRRGG